jgi:hypothetical protein
MSEKSQIVTYLKNFAGRLVSTDEFYKTPLSKDEKQGHAIVALALNKAADSPIVLGLIADELLNRITILNQRNVDIKNAAASTIETMKKDAKKGNKAPIAKPTPAPKKPVAKAVNNVVKQLAKNSGVKAAPKASHVAASEKAKSDKK